MSPRTPHDEEDETSTPAWSPETETREDVKALLLRRSALMEGEVQVFRNKLFPDIYDTYLETLRCVVRSRGARDAVEMELAHQALTDLFEECLAEGMPENIQAKLLSLASGLARNHVKREGRDPATHAMPTSSKEAPVTFPRPDRELDLKQVARSLFDRLSPDQQAMVDAVILRDLTVKAAARELGLERTTAGSRLTTALTLMTEWAEALLSPSERRL